MAQRRQRRSRDSLIASNAEKIYNDLWREVFGLVEVAQDRGIDLIPNGSPYERTVTLPDPPNAEPRVLTISLNKAVQLISVSGLKSNFNLQFDKIWLMRSLCPTKRFRRGRHDRGRS